MLIQVVRGREKGRQRTRKGFFVDSREPDVGLELGMVRSRPEPKSEA